jgi:integrase
MPQEIGASRTRPGSVNACLVGFYQSLAFRELAPGTQAMRRAIYERFRKESGDWQIATLPQKYIVQRLSRMKPVAARNWLKALRSLLGFAVSEGFRGDNPAVGIRLPKHKSDGHHAWTEDEITQFESYWLIGTRERLAFGLLIYTIQRRSDVIRMGPQHVRDGAIHIRQVKTGTPLVLPIPSPLQTILDATPAHNLTFVTTKTGRPFRGNDFSEEFATWVAAAGLPRRCTAHGLRKAGAIRAAMAGATAPQLMAYGGWKSIREVQRYIAEGDQRRLAQQAVNLTYENKTGVPVGKPKNQTGNPR